MPGVIPECWPPFCATENNLIFVAQPFLLALSEVEGAVLLGFSSQRPLRLCALCVSALSALSLLFLHWTPVAGHLFSHQSSPFDSSPETS
jgi:hypothetical protein